MKKTKMLALTLVVAIMLVGAGYAAWTDLIVHETVIDTGEFDVTFSSSRDATTIVDYLPGTTDDYKGLRDNFSVVDDLHNSFIITPSEDFKTMNFRFHNAYPGTQMKAALWAVNNGTLPAVIDEVVVDYHIFAEGEDGEKGTEIFDSKLEEAMKIDYNYFIQPYRSDWSRDYLKASNTNITLEGLEEELNKELRGLYMLPGEEFGGGFPIEGSKKADWAPFNFTFGIPADSLNNVDGVNEAQNQILELSITYNYVQHNMFELESDAK